MSSNPHPPAAYTMEELTAATSVTARTVRYYIVEGLLPPPDGAGPSTTYSEIHRNRLLLIGVLKDAYLPLKEIRRRLASMREEEIAAAVTAHEDASPSYAAPMDDGRDDAASYIDRILDQRTRRPTRQSLPGPDTPALERGPRRGSAPSPSAPSALPPANIPAAPAQVQTQSWKRLQITPEAELMIEEETYQRRQAQIDAAIDWLRRILNGS